jgi:hypothetical protein
MRKNPFSIILSFLLVFVEKPNELRIDAAEREKDRGKGHCAAASVRVGLSRTPNTATRGLGIKDVCSRSRDQKVELLFARRNNCT